MSTDYLWSELDKDVEVFTEKVIQLGLDQTQIEAVLGYTDELLVKLLELSVKESEDE